MNRKSILIVEDHLDLAESLRMLLQSWGHDVLVALDGWRALDLARRLRFDLLLVDIGLPGIDGFELAALLRQDGRLLGARIISMSGMWRASDAAAALHAGIDQHVMKPLDPVLLRSFLGPRR